MALQHSVVVGLNTIGKRSPHVTPLNPPRPFTISTVERKVPNSFSTRRRRMANARTLKRAPGKARAEVQASEDGTAAVDMLQFKHVLLPIIDRNPFLTDGTKQRKWLLEVIKDTVLSYLTKKLPPHVQVVGMLCRTPRKENRLEFLRRVAGGGGTFDCDDGGKVVLPKANLDDIANQADDLLETMEEKHAVPDRRLLARLVLIREEARGMMGGGILDERNNRGLSTLPDAEVAFVSKLVALRPGPAVRDKIRNVMRGRDEGADKTATSDNKTSGHNLNQETQKGRPVRPGMFLETVTKVLGGMYETNEAAGITVQHLEWVHKETLSILQEIAFGRS